MAIVNVTPSEFGDIIMIYLLDKLLHPKEVSKGNERFNEVINELSSRGVKASLTKYYLTTPVKMRFDYKRIKDVFEDRGTIQQIRIEPETDKKEPEEKEKKGGIIKRTAAAIKAALKKILTQGPESLSQEEKDMLNEWIEKEGDEIL